MLSRPSQDSQESQIATMKTRSWTVLRAWISLATGKVHHQAVLMVGDLRQCGVRWVTQEVVAAAAADLAMAPIGDHHNGHTRNREALMTRATASLHQETSATTTLAHRAAQ